MILEWLLEMVTVVVDWFLGLFDFFEIPAIFQSPPTEILTVFGYVQSMGVWVPWGVITTVLAAVVGVYVSFFIVKLVKQILAHVPGFGGAG